MPRLQRLRFPTSEKLTFLYVPDDAAVRQFRVPKFAFHAIAAAFLVGLGLLGWFGSQWIRAAAEGREMLRLRAENLALREQLEGVDRDLAQLRGEVGASEAIQQRLRLMANLDPLHPDVLEAGVGGPSVPQYDDSGALPVDLRDNLEHTSSHLSHMLRKARVQRESYEEILTVLQTNQTEWDHTPSVRPVTRAYVSSHFGRRMDPFTGQTAMHRGVDFAALRGSPVRSTASGIVTEAGRVGAYGLMIEVDHGNGLKTRYAHCSRLLVNIGDKVTRDTVIARVGSTGRSTNSHVHYEVIQEGLHQDPMKFLLPHDVVVD
jgi:murein DD-endopeptidase MepM/ murein hydrolase activator NlpD